MSGRKRFSWDATLSPEERSSSKKPRTETTSDLELSVSDLAPGMIRGQLLKIRVTFSGELFSSKDGRMLVHNFNAIGKDAKEISFVSFGETAEKMGLQITENKIYSIKTFEVKTSPPNYQKCENPLEIQLKLFSEVLELGDSNEVPAIPFVFKALKEVLNMPDGEPVDILGVVAEVSEVEEIGKRNAKKRDLILTDQGKCLVPMVLWGKMAENWDAEKYAVVAIRKALVSSYLGDKVVQYSSKSGTYIQVNPSIEQAVEIRGWFDAENQKRIEAEGESDWLILTTLKLEV